MSADFVHLEPPPPSTAASLTDLLPQDGRHAFRVLPAGAAYGEDDTMTLRGWKRLCDELLPALRSRGHLYNLIHRHRTNASLVLCRAVEDGEVVLSDPFAKARRSAMEA